MTTGATNRESRHTLSSVSNSTPAASTGYGRPQPKPLPAAITGAMFLPALERLCSSKDRVALTPHVAETWVAALSIYAATPKIVNRAVIEMATSEDPFPDLAKLLTKCERIRRTIENTLPQDATQIKFTNTKALAKAWGIDV